MHLKKIIPVVIAMLAMPFFMMAQVTTSSITGFVKNASGEALPGATIRATHVPTGTVYNTQARAGGRFDINNMNPGGPYTIVTSFVGYENDTRSEVFLALGEAQKVDLTLGEKATTITEVVISGTRAASTKTGSESRIGRDKLQNMPSVGRGLNDFVRLTPQVRVTGLGGISIAGQNNRYNSFMIDGAVNNDVFGLSDQGTNGGRAGIPPISIDAVDQITVQVSPFDAAVGNFTGGAINAITKSGTNDFHGSAYYIFRNQDMSGKTPGVADSLRKKLADFSNKTFGFTIGGPIIKNKAFFFINAERQDDSRPQPYTPSNILNPDGSIRYNIVDSVNKLVDHLKNTYGYDPGDWLNNPDDVTRTNLNTRFDFNLTNSNKLTVSYRYTKAERTNPGRSSNSSINFTNGAEFFPSTTHSGNAELNTKFSNKLNNKLRVSVTDVVDDRGPTGSPFPRVTISGFNGGPSFNFGTEAASSANLLKQRILNFYDVLKFYKGKHQFSLGADVDFNKSYNLFINRSFGQYTYGSLGPSSGAAQIGGLQAFMQDRGPTSYQRGYSLVDDPKTSGDANVNAAANFKSYRLGFFINDDIKVNNQFTLTVGLRADKTTFTTAVPRDAFFEDTARKVIEQYYDLKGAKSGEKFQPSWQLSPRVGFKYEVPDQGVTIRGGAGIFVGRTPLVWPGGLYQNNGVTLGAVTQNSTTSGGVVTPAQYNGAPLPFRDDVGNQFSQTDFGLPASQLKPQGDMNLIARDFKMPSSTKYNLAIDKKLGSGWTITVDNILTKNLNEVDWKNVNIILPTVKTSGPGANTIYSTAGNGNVVKLLYRPGFAPSTPQGNPYSNVILIQNTEGKKGFAYNFSFIVDKQFKKGLAFNASYSYGLSQVNNEGTSSVNTSNWQFGAENVRGRNFVTLTNSDQSYGHRITGFITKKFTYAKEHLATTITLNYNGQSGSPYSYSYSGQPVGDGVSGNDLIYVPASRAEMDNMVFVTRLASGATAAQNAADIVAQKDELEKFITKDKYLSKHRGQFAERNGARLPFTHVLDFAVQQDFSIKTGKTRHTLSVRADIANFTNLIDKSAGRQYFLSNDNYSLLTFRGYVNTPAPNTPTYQFFTPAGGRVGTISDGISTFNSSRWNGQLTIRYTF